MLNAIIESSLRNRFLVIVGTLLVAGLGVYSALHLPIDAVPDLTNIQVQVITEAPALSPLEVESLLSFPVEGAMSGLPNVEEIRSISLLTQMPIEMIPACNASGSRFSGLLRSSRKTLHKRRNWNSAVTSSREPCPAFAAARSSSST